MKIVPISFSNIIKNIQNCKYIFRMQKIDMSIFLRQIDLNGDMSCNIQQLFNNGEMKGSSYLQYYLLYVFI